MKKTIKSIINKLPHVRSLYQQTEQFKKNSCYPAGHYYSPIVSVDDIRLREAEIWKNEAVDGVRGINLNTHSQLALVKELSKYYDDIPFKEEKQENTRYYFKNNFYSYTDGIVLYLMMRHFKPKRIIEVGSGFSSALMLDTNELCFNNNIQLTFIEPYTKRLFSLMSETDKQKTAVIEKPVQEVNSDFFEQLQANDILFIDSSHIVKCGSDVNYILFEILPVLKSGVLIHFHDVFYPFEYPKSWVFGGFNWNEDYFLKAFLMYNNQFEIRYFSHYLHLHHREIFDGMPLWYKHANNNFWIQKI